MTKSPPRTPQVPHTNAWSRPEYARLSPTGRELLTQMQGLDEDERLVLALEMQNSILQAKPKAVQEFLQSIGPNKSFLERARLAAQQLDRWRNLERTIDPEA